MISLENGPNSPDFYNSLQLIAKIKKRFLKFSTSIFGVIANLVKCSSCGQSPSLTRLLFSRVKFRQYAKQIN